MTEPLLKVENLTACFKTARGTLKAVDNLSFSLDAGKTLAIVGESGCGKSAAALSILGLIPSPPGFIQSGAAYFKGKNLFQLSQKEIREIRGRQISIVFQEPMTALNPVFTVGEQIAEVLRYHEKISRDEARERSIESLRQVLIPSPEARYDEYPHQLSGGMRQRVLIAMALVCRPQLLIADEPTTALDVTLQAQIMSLLKDLQQRLGLGLILISHDLGVVSENADEVLVMYAGKCVERGATRDVLSNSAHPYTMGLIKSQPRMGAHLRRLYAIPGTVPDPLNLPAGCSFRGRCEYEIAECSMSSIELLPTKNSEGIAHLARCIRANDVKGKV